MKLSKIALTVLFGIAVTGCATDKMTDNGALEQAQETYQQYDDVSKQFNINEAWWKGYNDAKLNRLVEMALANNINLANAAITMNSALYNANLIGANLVPTFGGSGSATASKGLGHAATNNVSTGTSTISQSLSVNISYTLDLWHRLADQASAAEWTYKATAEDLASTRLSLINSVIDAYFNLSYLNDAIALTQQNIKYYQQIEGLLANRNKAGVIDGLSVEQATQSVLSARNNLISLQSSKKVAEQTLRNLLNLKPEQDFGVKFGGIAKVRSQGVDLNVPVSAIANRPDVKGNLMRVQSAFKTLKSTENSWFPTVTIGASISGNGRSAKAVGQNITGSGTLLSFDMPFLNWNTVKNNIKIDEGSYQTALNNYEQSITTALNEVDTYYYTYNQYRRNLSNLQQTLAHNKKISTYYKNRYDQGVSEFREWISAINTEKSAELSVLQAKYNVIQYENLVYQAMAGKYRR